MAVFDSWDEVFELTTKDFYAPIFSAPRKRRRKQKRIDPSPHRIPEYIQELQRLRRRSSIRQQTVASVMRTTQSTVSYFESGRGNPTIQFILRYCQAINIEIGIIFKEKPTK